MIETREEMVKRWEASGWLKQDCARCKKFYASPGKPTDVHGPSHRASDRCESGKRPHCTCDTCF